MDTRTQENIKIVVDFMGQTINSVDGLFTAFYTAYVSNGVESTTAKMLAVQSTMEFVKPHVTREQYIAIGEMFIKVIS